MLRTLLSTMIMLSFACSDDEHARNVRDGAASDASLDATTRARDAGIDAATLVCGVDAGAYCPLDWYEGGPCCAAEALRCSRGCFAHTLPDGGQGGWESFFFCQNDGTVGAGKGLFECTPNP